MSVADNLVDFKKFKINKNTELTLLFYIEKNAEKEFIIDNENYWPQVKNLLQDIIVSLIKKNRPLQYSNNMKIEVKVEKSEHFILSTGKDDTGILYIDPAKFKKENIDIARYIKFKVPLEKWYVMRWYGKKTTFVKLIEHELRHLVQCCKKFMFKHEKTVTDKRIFSSVKELTKGLDIYDIDDPLCKYIVTFIYALRNIIKETYAKLYDVEGPISFSHNELFQIKLNIMRQLKNLPPNVFFENDKTKISNIFNVYELSSSSLKYWIHKYAQFMAFMIAYAKMDKDAVIEKKNNLKVKDMNKIIEYGYEIEQPPLKIKNKVGRLLRTGNIKKIFKQFDHAVKILNINEKNIPLSYKLIDEVITKEKKNLRKKEKPNTAA